MRVGVRCLLLAVFLVIGEALAIPLATADGFVVIGNSQGAGRGKTLTQTQARLIFSTSQQAWPDGRPIQLVIFQPGSEPHQYFVKQALNLYPYQLERIWNRKLFSGTCSMAPIVVMSPKEMMEVVRRTPGAIGYLDKADIAPDEGDLTVIEVKP